MQQNASVMEKNNDEENSASSKSEFEVNSGEKIKKRDCEVQSKEFT